MRRLIQSLLRFFGFTRSEPVLGIGGSSPIKETEVVARPYSPKRVKPVSQRRSQKGKKYKVYSVKYQPFIPIELIRHIESDLLSEELNILAVSRKYERLKKSTMYSYFKDEGNSRVYRFLEYRVVECD